jgi:sterol desaturase/sphingolipid hydroxylase (fatty acid hydroxylase superfamily)
MSEAAFQTMRVTALAGTFLLALLLEWRWRHAALRPDWRTNLGLGAIGAAVMAVACGACGLLAADWVARHGIGLFGAARLPAWTALLLGVIALDGTAWLWHRANHRLGVLWRFHRVHHTDESFHFTTSFRFHPGELLLALPVRLAVIVALGIPPLGVLVFELVFGAANVMVHGNFDLPRKVELPFQRVLVSPALHRLHHSRAREERDTNFGTIFSCWDRWFGSFTASDAIRSVDTGLPGVTGGASRSLARGLAQPFTGAAARR